MFNNKRIVIGVAGGSGSGKSTVAYNLLKSIELENIVIIEQDAYYKNLNHYSLEERTKINFDHPDSIDFDLLIKHIDDLYEGKTIEKPIYDFTKHMRKKEVEVIESAKVIVVEGILIFAIPKLRKRFDMKIFVDTDDDERLLRRIERDINKRSRTFESVKNQYLETVKPMYLEFVEPSKRYADIIIPRGGDNKIAINMVGSNITSIASLID